MKMYFAVVKTPFKFEDGNIRLDDCGMGGVMCDGVVELAKLGAEAKSLTAATVSSEHKLAVDILMSRDATRKVMKLLKGASKRSAPSGEKLFIHPINGGLRIGTEAVFQSQQGAF
jgi:nitrogen regulatory protein PII